VRDTRAALGVVVIALIVASCGGSNKSATGPNAAAAQNRMTTNNLFACTALDGMYLDMASGKAIATSTARDVIFYGEKAENPAVRRAANQIARSTDAHSVAGTKTAMLAYAAACHAMGSGPQDIGTSP